MRQAQTDKEARLKKFDKDKTYFRFVYCGEERLDNGCGVLVDGHYGMLVNERLEMRKIQDEKANRWWSHTYPDMKFESLTKEQLWSDIKEYVSNYRNMFDSIISCNGQTFLIKKVGLNKNVDLPVR